MDTLAIYIQDWFFLAYGMGYVAQERFKDISIGSLHIKYTSYTDLTYRDHIRKLVLTNGVTKVDAER